MMLVKKNTAGMLLIAFAIFFLHDIIPHHHHHHQPGTEHHPINHHHDDDQQENGLSGFLSFIFHSGDGFTVTGNQNLVKHFNKHFNSDFFLTEVIEFTKLEIPPLIFCPPPESDHFIEFLACTKGLRAPPAFIS